MEGAVIVRIKLVDAQGAVYLVHVVVGIGQRDDGAALHEHRQFPQRSVEVVDDASALVHVAVEVVYPRAFGQVDAVAHVVAFVIGLGGLVYGSHQEIRPVEVLILGGFAPCVAIGIFQE